MATQGNTLGAERLVAQVAAVFSIGAGVIHVSAAGDHTNLPVMFAGFLAVAAAQIALGALLMWRRPPRWLALAGIVLMIGSIGVWLLSRTEGLPFLEDGHTEPVGFKDGVTVLFEAASIPALLLLLSRDLARVSLPSPRLETQTLTALGMCCFALMVPALMLEGGGHHSHEQAVALGIHSDDHEGGDEVAHADPRAHESESGDGHHATKADKKAGHRRKHKHSDVELAAAPLGGGHEHGGGSADPPNHHDGADKDEGKNHGGRHRGDRRDRPDRDHGHGDHEGEEPAAEPSDEPPISVSYGPEPGVCIGSVCIP